MTGCGVPVLPKGRPAGAHEVDALFVNVALRSALEPLRA